MTILRKLLRNERGVGTIEYALVAMLIGVGAISAYANLGTKIQGHWATSFDKISTHL